jgi:hypothetical protein
MHLPSQQSPSSHQHNFLPHAPANSGITLYNLLQGKRSVYCTKRTLFYPYFCSLPPPANEASAKPCASTLAQQTARVAVWTLKKHYD